VSEECTGDITASEKKQEKHKQTGIEKNKQTHKLPNKQTSRQTDKQANLSNKKTNIKTKQANKPSYIHHGFIPFLMKV
jgi:hypothetical protein